MKFLVYILTAGLFFSWFVPAQQAIADDSVMVITIKVSKDGFDKQPEKRMQVTPGTKIRLVFEFDEGDAWAKMMNIHEFVLVSGGNIIAKTPELTAKTRRVTLKEFTAGENSEAWYRVQCIQMCIGMENLIDFVIWVKDGVDSKNQT